ncbi:MAG: patatin-like phospholipase family protein, partial [Longimicrobiales bacterium]
MELEPLEPLNPVAEAAASHGPSDLGLVMGGGGARAAYQVGVLRHIAQHYPRLEVPYIHGISAGAINAAGLASHHGTFLQAVDELSHLWGDLTIDHVFRVDPRSLAMNSMRWLRQLGGGGLRGGRIQVRGLVDTTPLDAYLTETLHAVDRELTGIQYNVDHGGLKAFAVSTT